MLLKLKKHLKNEQARIRKKNTVVMTSITEKISVQAPVRFGVHERGDQFPMPRCAGSWHHASAEQPTPECSVRGFSF